MPAVEEYGAQPPIEMLRLYQDRKGFYDREQLIWKDAEDSVLIAAAAPPGGGRSDLTPRFTRHFTMMCLPPASFESLMVIFKSILEGFFKSYTFKPEIVSMANNLVQATLEIYDKISTELLPTPAKSHYTFNLRDVSKVFQGILLTKPPKGQNTPFSVPNSTVMCRLWVHETCRVFYDRLVNDTDRNWFKETLKNTAYAQLGFEFTPKELFDDNVLVFADFMRRGVDLEERIYEDITDYPKLVRIIGEYMTEESDKPMDLVLFKDAVEHLCRVSRILRFLRGHAMLVGLGGSGKKSITKLAALLAGCKLMMIELKKNYKEKDFREDLFNMMKEAAIVGKKPVVFLLPDTHIIHESFLEDINNLLNSGEVPNMLGKEQMNEINNTLPEIMKANGVNKEVYSYWVERVRSNLHIVLAVSPVGDKLRNRIRMFPSLVNCCTIDWIKPWPEDALLSVSKMFLDKADTEG